jgi:hypothetical protein
VTVLVLVLVLVEIVVLVLGVVVVVVVVAVVVVGLSVDVVVAGVSVVVPGSALCVTVSVPPVGAGRTEPPDGDDDVVGVDDVPEGLEASPSVNDTMAYTITATTMTASAPRLTRPAGRRYQGVGGAGGGCWPYSGC